MTSKKSLFVVLLVLVVFGAGSVFLWNYVSTKYSPSGDKIMSVSLRLKWIYDPGFAGEEVAAKAGLFEKYGIKVEIKPGGFEADPIKLVAAGSDQIGVAGADSFLIARSKGVPIVAFAAGYLETPVVYYVHADSGIQGPKDFVGRKVGYSAGQDAATIYEAMVRLAGVDRSKITEVPVKYDFTPFLQRQIDVWPGYAANQSELLEREKIPYRTIRPGDYGISFIGTVYFTTEEYLKRNPEVIAAFTKGLIDGWNMTYRDEEKSIPLISSYDPQALTPQRIKFSLERQKSSILPAGYRYAEYGPAQWAELHKILLTAGLISGPVDLRSAVTYEFINAAYGK